mgnify:FL=1
MRENIFHDRFNLFFAIFVPQNIDMKLRYPIVVLLFLSFALNGCLKEDSQVFTCSGSAPKVTVPGSELLEIESYLSKNSITDAVKSDLGFYYKIVTPGTGAAPTVCSNVTIYYKGSLLNGSIFDQTTNSASTFPLSRLIVGWQYGLPLIKPGGKIILYLPPSLGYGAAGSPPTIPANSSLIFEISLVAA